MYTVHFVYKHHVCVYLHYDMYCVRIKPAMLLARLASELVKSLARTVFLLAIGELASAFVERWVAWSQGRI